MRHALGDTNPLHRIVLKQSNKIKVNENERSMILENNPQNSLSFLKNCYNSSRN
jgi:hypothetical protein